VTQTKSNDAYAYQRSSGATSSTANGLNQLTGVGGLTVTHDANGNVTAKGSRGFTYDSENRFTGEPRVSAELYDGIGRLWVMVSYLPSFAQYRVIYDGDQLIRDDPNGRYVHGDGVDEPLVWYDSTGTRRFLHADERGSIIAVTDSAGGLIGINRYDDYGNVQGTQTGRLGYTGQFTLPGGIVHYNARAYEPGMGRFLQTDPVGYDAGPNLYAYVGNDPVNLTDPLGLSSTGTADLSSVRPQCYTGDFCDANAIIIVASCGMFCTSTDPQNLLLPPFEPRSIGPGGESVSGSPKPRSNRPTKKPTDQRSTDVQICRATITGMAAYVLAGGSLGEAMHVIEGSDRIAENLTALDFFKTGARGAEFGARFGILGAVGFIGFAGGLYYWNENQEQILSDLCGE